MKKLLIFSLLLLVSGCGSESIILSQEGGEIESGYYTGTITNTIIAKTSSGDETTTKETVPVNIQINDDGTIYSNGQQISVGTSETIDLGGDPMIATVTGISGDTDTLVISFTISGNYETATISGYVTETFQSNIQGGLNFEQYTQVLMADTDFSIYLTSSGKTVLTK